MKKYKFMESVAIKIVSVFFILVSFNAIAARPATCESEKNQDLISCAEYYHSIADNKLNEKYKQVSSDLSGSSRQLLQSAQRDWIKFRDGYCSDYDPQKGAQGREAEIDFLSCKARLSNARTFEMQALLDDGGNSIYESALAKISALYAKAPVDTIKKEIISSGSGDKLFDSYAKKNCELSALLSKEPEESCLSRVYFMGK